MILQLQMNAEQAAIDKLMQRLVLMGFQPTIQTIHQQKVIVLLSGMDKLVCTEEFAKLPIVEKVMPITCKHQYVGKSIKQEKTVIEINGVRIGGDEFVVMAGPCSIESREQIFAIAKQVSQSGAVILRGGAFKPRTSPYDFQGLGEAGLAILREAADTYGLLCVSEVMSVDQLSMVEKYVDILQIGARNMQNYNLLKAVGQSTKPILLKRGMSATYQEFLSAAEYIMSAGNPNVILCERGIRTFETHSRNTLDLAAVPLLRELTHLPIVVDPSHGVGVRAAVPAMANGAIAVKADGLIIEVHTHPDQSISDALQTISTNTFSEIMTTLKQIGLAVGLRVKEAQLC